MASADVQILGTGSKVAPLDYNLPLGSEILLKAVRADFDGTAALTAYKPALEIISDAGHQVGLYATDDVVAAGGSASVSFAPFLRNGSGGTDVDIQTFQLNGRGVTFAGGTAILANATPTLAAWGPVSTSDGTGVAFDIGIFDPAGQHLQMPIITDTTFTYVYSFMVKVFWPAFAGFRSVKVGISAPGSNLGWDLPCEVHGTDAVEDAVQTVTGEIFALDGVAPQFIFVTLEQRSGAPQTLSTGAPSYQSIIQMQAIGDTP